MKSLHLLAVVLSFAMCVAWTDPLAAQISVGGFNVGGDNSNRDDNNNDNNQNRGTNRRRRSNNQGNNQGGENGSNSNNLQGLIPGYQGNQGQGTNKKSTGTQLNRTRPNNQFPGNNQGNNQQFQNWPHNNRDNNWDNNQNNITIGTWQGGKWNGSRNVNNWTKAYGGEAQPFSQQWYQNHPKAWKYNNNNANVWVVASMPGVYSWLGWGDVPPQYNVGYERRSSFDHSHYGDWYPLGVFSLMSGPGDSGTRIVQLAVDHHGHIAGNYYDMITGSNYSVSGEISRQSQRVSWSLNKNQSIRFRTHISQLLQPYGTINVRMPGGEQQWQFVRLEN